MAQASGGFRIAGQRISFSMFIVLITLAVAATNLSGFIRS